MAGGTGGRWSRQHGIKKQGTQKAQDRKVRNRKARNRKERGIYDIQSMDGGLAMKKMIYLDNAATTQVAPEALDAMIPYFTEFYGNPSSIYSFAGEAKKAMEEARRTLAAGIGAKPEEIYFTGGGSEADNWALKGAAEAYAAKGKHIITTRIEHHAILHTAEYL